MRLFLALAVVLTANVTALAGTQEDGQAARLRQSISPSFVSLIGKMSLTMGLSYSPDLGYIILRERPDLSAAITETTKALGEGVADAPLYARLGALYRAEGNLVSAHDAYRRSGDLYRVLLTHNPHDGRAIAAYSLTLLRLGQSDEAEAWLRHAGKNNAEVQIAMGRAEEERAAACLKQQPPRPDLAQAALDEAGNSYDNAVRLAPNSASVWAMRAEFRAYTRPQRQALINALQQHHPIGPEMMISLDGLADCKQAARLSPQSPYAIAMPVWFDVVYFAVTHHTDMADANNVPKVSVQARQCAHDTILRLKALTQAKDSPLAAQAWTALAWVQFEFYGDAPGAIRSLLQALEDDRSRQDAADYLLHVAAVIHNNPLLAALCRREAPYDHSTRLHLILAYADTKIARYEEATSQLEVAYQQERPDFDIRLALTALLMKTGWPADLARAGNLIDPPESAIPKTATSSQSAEYEALRGVYDALQDEPEQARNLLLNALKTDPTNPQAKEALAALPATDR